MSADSMFWAGMAGGRFQQIQRLNAAVEDADDAIEEWKQHTAELEQTIAALRRNNEKLKHIENYWIKGYPPLSG